MEMTDVRRRTFLTATVASIGGLLSDRLPGAGIRVDGEPLTELEAALAQLRHLDGRDGSLSILMPVSWLAGRLLHAVAATPPGHDAHDALAMLTAQAADLAGWAAFETGEYGSALSWYDRSIDAAAKAGDLSFVAFAAEARAQVLWRGLKKTGPALAALDAIKLDSVTPNVRSRVYGGRARVLALQGNEPAAHRALEASMEAASKVVASEDPWAAWAASPANATMRQGLTFVDLGYGEAAERLLSGSLRRLPGPLRRVGGTIHCGLARAAFLTGEPEKAAEHVVRAHSIFAATRSRRIEEIQVVASDLQARYPGVRAVAELDEQLRTDTRYVLCDTADHKVKIHQASCGYARRGRARPWPAGEHLLPAQVASDPLRGSHGLCERCMPV
jgi:tetratricopeptide (TPR) repeat protein